MPIAVKATHLLAAGASIWSVGGVGVLAAALK
jgi:hypothetical protein